MRRTIVTVAVLGLALGGVAGAYDGAPVTGGGSVSGQVKLAGAAPANFTWPDTEPPPVTGALSYAPATPPRASPSTATVTIVRRIP